MTDNIDINDNTNNTSRLQQTRELITELNKLNSEVIVPSEGSPYVESRDPHLRLRRTLTPFDPLKYKKGMSDEEAQFMIHNSTGERVSLSFSCFNEDFICDGYFWGVSEENATKRIFAVHGVTPGISRTRWHSLGERLTMTKEEDEEDDEDDDNKSIRFCAIDWHSIDRTDKSQNEFLTMLPKHFFDPVDDKLIDKMYGDDDLQENNKTKIKDMISKINENCPRSIEDGAVVLRAMIEQGCGWGTSSDKAFILCIKSWSGAVGMEMIIKAAAAAAAATTKNDDDDDENKGGGDDSDDFHKNIAAAVIMHPGYFKEIDNLKEVLNFPVIMCWAKDDPKVNYNLFAHRYIDAGAKIVSPETGGHSNFPEFDQEASKFIHDIRII
jgi:hypothetical protein